MVVCQAIDFFIKKNNFMRKLLFAVLFFTSTSYAQNFQAGIKAGVNISNFTGGNFNTIENNTLLGFHAGGLLRFKFGGFALQPKFYYPRRAPN